MIRFVKAHANGNDFLIIEAGPGVKGHSELTRKLCSRNTGVGADGIEFVERRVNGDFFLRLFNADGSEAELSGNGTRCVAAWLAHLEHLNAVSLNTHSGTRMCAVVQAAFPHYLIESEMGIPRVMPRTIDIPGLGNIRGAMVNVGNPHFVVLTDNDDFSAHGLRWQEIGSIISKAPIFKYGTNVEFVRLLSPSEIEFRIFERGCGPTTSSGTGSCAASAAAIFLAGSDRSLKVMSEGGVQTTAWPAPDAVMKLTGPAEIVCEGEVFES